jgi:hypothetical protein
VGNSSPGPPRIFGAVRIQRSARQVRVQSILTVLGDITAGAIARELASPEMILSPIARRNGLLAVVNNNRLGG